MIFTYVILSSTKFVLVLWTKYFVFELNFSYYTEVGPTHNKFQKETRKKKKSHRFSI